jgi:hypothetical protein
MLDGPLAVKYCEPRTLSGTPDGFHNPDMAKKKRKRAPKTVLKLPDLEQSKCAVLNSLPFLSSQRFVFDNQLRLAAVRRLACEAADAGEGHVRANFGAVTIARGRFLCDNRKLFLPKFTLK